MPGFLFNKKYEEILLSELDYEYASRENVEFINCRGINKSDDFINFLDFHIKFDIPKLKKDMESKTSLIMSKTFEK